MTVVANLAPNARIPCTRCGRPCRSHLTRICKTCYRQLPAGQRPNLNSRSTWAHQTGTTTVNAAPPDDLQHGSEPGSKFESTPEQIASVQRHIDERALDAADHADLTRTIFGSSK